jgi:hypothetical protein
MANGQSTPIPFKLLFGRRSEGAVEVRVIESPMGQPHTSIPLSVEGDWKNIASGAVGKEELAAAGQALYSSLFDADIKSALTVAWNQARTESRTITLQLRFDEDATELAAYPWELLHDGRRHLLISGELDLARYIAYPEASVPLEPAPPPLRVLYVGCSPRDMEVLDLAAPVAPLKEMSTLAVEELAPPPTYDALMKRLAPHNQPFDVLYFHGHGSVLKGEGGLVFQKEDGSPDIVWARDLAVALGGSRVKLAVLVACRSAGMGEETVFSATGPALIQAGVPAVAAMQYRIPPDAGANFAAAFFEALAKGQPLTEAMIYARKMLYRGQDWYIPTLYLRSADDAGLLLQPGAAVEAPARPSPPRPDTTPFTPPPDPPTRVVRALLDEAFNDQELQEFCGDYFEEVASNFSLGMLKRQKIGVLIDYCQRRVRMEELLTRIHEVRPEMYAEFAAELEGGG